MRVRAGVSVCVRAGVCVSVCVYVCVWSVCVCVCVCVRSVCVWNKQIETTTRNTCFHCYSFSFFNIYAVRLFPFHMLYTLFILHKGNSEGTIFCWNVCNTYISI